MLVRRLSVLSLLLAAALAAGCASRPAATPATAAGTDRPRAAGAVEVVLLQLNDVYEIGPVQGGKSGGLARVATVRERLQAENPHTFTVLAGDFLSPSALGTAKVAGETLAGKQMVAVLNLLGLDLVTFGNHEFDIKEDQLLARLGESRFRWTSANVLRASGEPFPGVSKAEVLHVAAPGGPLEIGIVGVTLDSNKAAWVSYQEPIAAFQREAEALAGRGVDALIALTHLAFDQDATLAAAVPAVALVLGGHEHENVRAFRAADFTPIVKADANARTVYVHRLRIDRAAGTVAVDSELVIVDESIPEDPEVAAEVARWQDLAFDAFRADGFEPTETVAVTTVELDGTEAGVRNRPTALTGLVARAFQAEAAGTSHDAEVVAAVFNSGSIRIDDVLPPGPVTQYDVIRILPFGGKVLTVDVTGSLLARLLDQGLAARGSGGFLQTASIGGTTGAWTVAGTPLDPGRTYRVATNDYLGAGKQGGMEFFAPGPELTVVAENRDQRMAVIDELRREYPPG